MAKKISKQSQDKQKQIEQAKKLYVNWYDVVMHKAKPIEIVKPKIK